MQDVVHSGDWHDARPERPGRWRPWGSRRSSRGAAELSVAVVALSLLTGVVFVAASKLPAVSRVLGFGFREAALSQQSYYYYEPCHRRDDVDCPRPELSRHIRVVSEICADRRGRTSNFDPSKRTSGVSMSSLLILVG